MFIRSSFETHSAMVHASLPDPNTDDLAPSKVSSQKWVALKHDPYTGSCLAPGGVIRLYVFSPLRDLAGGQHAWRTGAEGCIGRGGIALCGCCLSLATVCQARACVGDDA